MKLIDKLSNGVMKLNKQESLEAIFNITEEEEYRYFAILILKDLPIDTLTDIKDKIWKIIKK